jgi:DNA-binding XRE family transcriptional regulator
VDVPPLGEAPDIDFGIGRARKVSPPSPLGAGFLILVVRELTGLSQRRLASRIGTSQPTLATLESGNRRPTIADARRLPSCVSRARSRGGLRDGPRVA